MNIHRNKRQGFTLIELLVVIGIIGVLATISVASLQSAQKRARDTKRLSNIRDLQTNLFMYYGDHNKYPTGEGEGVSSILGSGSGYYSVLCDTDAGFQTDTTGCATIYLNPIPSDPKSGPGSLYEYTYTGSADRSDYTLEFKYEAGVGGLQAGDRKATKSGLE